MSPFLKDGWELVNTSMHSDPDTRHLFTRTEVKPDMALYKQTPRTGGKICNAATAEQFGKFKLLPDTEPFRWEGGKGPFERDTQRAKDTRGQLTTYLNAIQALQQRTRVFSFHIRKEWCRLLVHSRAGTLVTSLFNWTTQDHLQRYFWVYTHSPPKNRGFDTTFEIAKSLTPAQTYKIQGALKLSNNDPLYTVTVNDEIKGALTFYVSRPFTTMHTYPVGRGTRCFSAYDPTSKKIVLLKDTWCVEEYKPEHEIYKKLHQKGVPNISEVVAAGHVPNHHGKCGSTNSESTQRVLVHYRLVLKVHGKPLSKFTSTHQLVSVVRDAFEGEFLVIPFEWPRLICVSPSQRLRTCSGGHTA